MSSYVTTRVLLSPTNACGDSTRSQLRKLTTTSRFLELVSILMYIKSGCNATHELFKLIRSLSARLHMPIISSKAADIFVKQLQVNITKINGLVAALTRPEVAFLGHLVPVESVTVNTTWRWGRNGTKSRLECTNRLTVDEGVDIQPLTDAENVIDFKWEKPMLDLHYETSDEATSHRPELK
ncbi:hypothetical protein J8273_5264 [Carpediemonas membranifera]|uniref:Uncharacterized protein n=1 Tax=Carpediemonas membranifera TaxID=201153 RepID=A0A8J6E8R0_9EUKA|nr:hypothetical protein J8273_5264 [Carpediemonas membranifera]|eukprot:KAG9392275.1 hypothetical protein J8273_5264 [Carpediemonas membranifera]